MNSNIQIKVSGLRVCYGEQEVLHGLSFSIGTGEFVAVVGKSGVGKSTLLHALAGFVPSEGEMKVSGRVGVVFQNYAVFPWLTASENVAVGLKRIGRQGRKQVVDEYLDLVGLSDCADKYPSQMSGGQTQRVALARTLAANPEVIFFDEPFGALDIYTRERMQTWLLDIWDKQRKTVFFVTHSIDEAIYLSDRILVMGEGEIIGEFRVEMKRPRTETIKFSKPFIDLKRRILDAM